MYYLALVNGAALMKVYVINLRRRTDRGQSISQELLRVGVDDWAFGADIGCEFDGLCIKQELARYSFFPWKINSQNEYWNRNINVGEICCVLAHHCVWKHAFISGEPWCLVVEDDAVFKSNMPDIVSGAVLSLCTSHPDWDILYVGRERLGADTGVGGGIVRPGYTYGTHGYALSRAGLYKLLNSNLLDSIMPLDEYLSATFCQHPRVDVSGYVNVRLQGFALESDCVWQDDRLGSDIEGSPDCFDLLI